MDTPYVLPLSRQRVGLLRLCCRRRRAQAAEPPSTATAPSKTAQVEPRPRPRRARYEGVNMDAVLGGFPLKPQALIAKA